MIKLYNMSLQKGTAHKLEIDFKWFKFPGGELHFNVDSSLMIDGDLHIETDLCNSDEIMLVMLLSDTYRHRNKYLELLYTPYARQDRRTSHNEPFSLRAFAKLINSCGFKRVTVYDPHSDVTAALIDNIFVIKRLELVKKHLQSYPASLASNNNAVIISPDAGAMKTNQEIAHHYEIPHVVATKVRDIKTGDITVTQVHTDLSLEGMELFILDDICDGGRTFIELAKILKNHNPQSIHLYTTVSISQKGRDAVRQYYNTQTFNHQLGE